MATALMTDLRRGLLVTDAAIVDGIEAFLRGASLGSAALTAGCSPELLVSAYTGGRPDLTDAAVRRLAVPAYESDRRYSYNDGRGFDV